MITRAGAFSQTNSRPWPSVLLLLVRRQTIDINRLIMTTSSSSMELDDDPTNRRSQAPLLMLFLHRFVTKSKLHTTQSHPIPDTTQTPGEDTLDVESFGWSTLPSWMMVWVNSREAPDFGKRDSPSSVLPEEWIQTAKSWYFSVASATSMTDFVHFASRRDALTEHCPEASHHGYDVKQSSTTSRLACILRSPRHFVHKSPVALDECGFFVNPNTLSLSGIWHDPELLTHRIDTHDLDLSRRIASSGIAEVWLGSWRGSTVAVKRLRSEDQTVEFADQFAEASKTFIGIMHPKIVFVVGVAWTKARDIHVVMEYVNGGDLHSLLSSAEAASLTWGEFKCHVAIDIAMALDHLHSTDRTVNVGGLVPRNVLLDSTGVAKLSLLHVSRYSTLQTLEYGEVECIAPEALRGESLTANVDIYAFGVLLTELDTAQEPYKQLRYPDGRTAEKPWIAMQIAEGHLMPTVSSDCPPAIAQLAQDCLAYDPDKRPDATRIVYTLLDILKNEL